MRTALIACARISIYAAARGYFIIMERLSRAVVVEHELERWSVIHIPDENPGNPVDKKETCARSIIPVSTLRYSSSMYTQRKCHLPCLTRHSFEFSSSMLAVSDRDLSWTLSRGPKILCRNLFGMVVFLFLGMVMYLHTSDRYHDLDHRVPPHLPLWEVVQDLHSTDPTQDICATSRSCRSCGSHPATWATTNINRPYKIGNVSALKDLDHGSGDRSYTSYRSFVRSTDPTQETCAM